MTTYPAPLMAYCEQHAAILADIHAIAQERAAVEAQIGQRQTDYLHKTEASRRRTNALKEQVEFLWRRQHALLGEWWKLQADYQVQAYDEREYVRHGQALPPERLRNYEHMEREIAAGGYRDEEGCWWPITRDLLYPPSRKQATEAPSDPA